MATYNYCLLHFVYFILVIVALCLPRFRRMTSLVIGLYVMAVFVTQMVGGAWIYDPAERLTKNETLNEWIGIRKRSNYEYLVSSILLNLESDEFFKKL